MEIIDKLNAWAKAASGEFFTNTVINLKSKELSIEAHGKTIEDTYKSLEKIFKQEETVKEKYEVESK